MGLFLFVMFFDYCVGFLVGTIFIRNDVKATDGDRYSGGVVVIVFFSAVTGFFYIGTQGSNLTAINEARIAAYEIR